MPNADDRAEIVQGTHLYARGLDRFDPKEALSAYTDYVLAEGRTTGGASIKAAAFNVDIYRRTADGWKIASRVITPLTTPQMEGFEA